MKGFFDIKTGEGDLQRQGGSECLRCGECGLKQNCKSPAMAASGQGEKDILVLAQSPGKEEDKQGTQLVGRSGELARGMLEEAGIDLERDCRRLNAVNCYPNGARVKSKHVQACRPMVMEEIRQNPPSLIIPMGGEAVESLIGHRYIGDRNGLGGPTRWRGWRIPDQELKCWICPVLHPSYLLRNQGRNGEESVSQVLTQHDLWHAVKCLKEPFPDHGLPREKVKILWKRREIYGLLKDIENDKTAAAFDFETTGLKPEREGHRILTCAICPCPDIAYAFPVQGVEKALAEWLQSDQPKAAANKKFEERWARRCLGTAVNNWYHDTMVDGHVLDNRSAITSVKFQTAVRFGIYDYDSHVDEYKHSAENDQGGNAFNRLHEMDPEELLIYNGIDAWAEKNLSLIQELEHVQKDD